MKMPTRVPMTPQMRKEYEAACKDVPHFWHGVVLGLGEEFRLYWRNHREWEDNHDLAQEWEVWQVITGGPCGLGSTAERSFKLAIMWVPRLVHKAATPWDCIDFVTDVTKDPSKGHSIPIFAISHEGASIEALNHIACKRHEELWMGGSC